MIAWIITGTRSQLSDADRATIRQELQDFAKQHGRPDLVMHGDCDGVDRFVSERIRQALPQTAIFAIPGDWGRYDKKAGPYRNSAMVQLALLLRDWSTYEIRFLAFPRGESKGTRDCAGKCQAAGFEGVVVELEVQP